VLDTPADLYRDMQMLLRDIYLGHVDAVLNRMRRALCVILCAPDDTLCCISSSRNEEVPQADDSRYPASLFIHCLYYAGQYLFEVVS
jgi:hypothetical protein